MKTLTVILNLIVLTTSCFAQGKITWSNGNQTLISVDGAPMPGSTNQLFYFACFLAPSTSVILPGQSAAAFWADPAFQVAGGYNTNHPFALGRIAVHTAADVGGTPGETVDFLIRAWSANAGSDWATARANWNNGNPSVADAYFGESLVGDNLVLSDGASISPTAVFGIGGNQVPGFNLISVPEPASILLIGFYRSRATRAARFLKTQHKAALSEELFLARPPVQSFRLQASPPLSFAHPDYAPEG